MEIITRNEKVNSYSIETRTQNGAFRVVLFNRFGSIVRQNYYADAKKATACFNRFKKQASNY